VTTGSSLPAAEAATHNVVLDFADEQSVVQTRFATTALALWRAHVGGSLAAAIHDAADALTASVAEAAEQTQFTFLGTGWTVGLANEAALKVREASQSWAESYPAMEFRHGPISVIDEGSVVSIFGPAPDGLVEELRPTGALVVRSERDPMAQLVGAQLLAVELARAKGLDPDAPRNLTRSIILPAG
jgi:glucosamine 6-phosphate synthetase-like amidotransferase/phosphosugar isomerase protein